MVHLDRIYTRSGDEGQTSLGDGSRVSKTDQRIVAMGSVDELNASLGVTLASVDLSADMRECLTRVQNTLFDVGADVCVPLTATSEKRQPLRIPAEAATQIEKAIDRFNDPLEPLNSFILPGGTRAAAQLHQARTICRRAEVDVLRLAETEPINPAVTVYLNRISDLLFVLARVCNAEAGCGDELWQPGGSREVVEGTRPLAGGG